MSRSDLPGRVTSASRARAAGGATSDVAGGGRGRRRLRLPGRRWLDIGVVLVLMALGGLGGQVAHGRFVPTYTASTTVLVLPTAGGLDSSVGGSRTAAEVQIETEAELLQSAQVSAAAVELLDGAISSKELLRNSVVTVPPNSQVLMVSFTATTPDQARDGSMALAEAYLDRRAAEATDENAGVVTSLEGQLADLTTRLKETSAAQADVPTDNQAQIKLLEAQRALLVDGISDINSRLVALRMETSPGGEIVTAAQLPDEPTSPALPLLVGAGLALGALAAGGLLLALSRVRERPQAQRRLDSERVPVLATLSLSHPEPSGGSTGPDVFHFVDEDEALRRLCVKVSSFQGVPGPTVIVGVGDPLLRTRVGTSLNRSWAAEFGGSVLVLTEAGNHVSAAGVSPGEPGLRDALRGRTGILDTSVVPIGSYAGVVGPGRDTRVAATAAQRGLLPEVWASLEGEFGAVLVQTGSPLDNTLAQSIAQSAGRFVVLVEVGVGQKRDLTSTLEEIEWLDLSDRVAGVVIVSNRPAPPPGESGSLEPPTDQLSDQPRRAAPHHPDSSGAARE